MVLAVTLMSSVAVSVPALLSTVLAVMSKSAPEMIRGSAPVVVNSVPKDQFNVEGLPTEVAPDNCCPTANPPADGMLAGFRPTSANVRVVVSKPIMGPNIGVPVPVMQF